VKILETPLLTGPVIVEVDAVHEVSEVPVRIHTGAPVGATDPVDPVIVAVNVVTWPVPVVVCTPMTLREGFAFGTAIVTIGELLEL